MLNDCRGGYFVGFVWLLLWAPVPAAGDPMPVYLEYSPAAQELAATAADLAAHDRLIDAAGVYQQIIERYPQKLMPAEHTGEVDTALHTDAAVWVRRVLIRDQKLLDAYRGFYGSDANRALAAARQPDQDLSALEDVLARYTLCTAGIEAGLDLAGAYLERGWITYADTVLDGLTLHPDRASRQIRWHTLIAACLLFAGDRIGYQDHLNALNDLNAESALAELRSWDQGLRPPADTVVFGGDNHSDAKVPEQLGLPLWEMPTSLASVTRVVRSSTAKPNRAMSVLLRASLPIADADRLYVNDMGRVVALDPVSGAVAWYYDDLEHGVAGPRLDVMRRSMHGTQDPRGVLISGPHVWAVVGVGSTLAQPGTPNAKSSTVLVCLDRSTGRLLQRIEPGELDRSLRNANFHGTPVGGSGGVFIPVVRDQASGFRDAYLLAVGQGGRLHWRRHLSSTASGRFVVPKMTQVIEAEGWLYVADGRGVVACLASRDGAVQWLAQLDRAAGGNPPGDRRVNSVRNSWMASSPILTDAGLLVPHIDPVTQDFHAVLLDPTTGLKVKNLNRKDWSKASYAVAAPGGILLVGQTVSLLDETNLQPRWSTRLGETEKVQPYGRVGLTRHRALLPTQERLIVLNLDNGDVVGAHRLAAPGHVLAMEDQVVIAGSRSVRGYLSWAKAYQHLSGRMKKDVMDPRPGMSLAQLALNAGREDAVLEGVDHAVQASESRRAATVNQAVISENSGDQSARPIDVETNKTVFYQVLDLASGGSDVSTRLRELLLDRLAKATQGPGDEVAYHLTVGLFFEEMDNGPEAVEHYQAILLDPLLSAQQYHGVDGEMQAGFEARRRLEQLIEQRGRRVYAKYETLAAQQLVELSTREVVDEAELLALAGRFPVSQSASAAILSAAEVMAGHGNPHGAIRELARAYNRASAAGLLQRILGRIVELNVAIGRPATAIDWLERAQREHPELMPLRAGQPVAINRWVDHLGRLVDNQESQLATLSLPLGQPQWLTGRVLGALHQPWDQVPTDRLVTQEKHVVQMWRAPAFDLAWEASVGGVAELLTMNQSQVLLLVSGPEPVPALMVQADGAVRETMLGRPGTASRLVALDAQTGEEMWPSIDPAALLTVASGGRVQERARAATSKITDGRFIEGRVAQIAQRSGLPRPAAGGQRVLVNDMVVCVVDNTGRTIAIDRHSGEVLWARDCPVQQVHRADLDDEVLVVAGVAEMAEARRAGAGVIVVVDSQTGQVRHGPIHEKQVVRWVGLNKRGTMVYLTGDRVVGYRTGGPDGGGGVAWVMDSPDPMTTGRGWFGNGLLLQTLGVRRPMTVIDAGSGDMIERIAGRLASHRGQVTVRWALDQWHVLTPRWTTVIGPAGRVLWRDGISLGFDQEFVLQLLGQDVTVLLGRTVDLNAKNQRNGRVKNRIREERPADAQPPMGGHAKRTRAGHEYTVYLLDRKNGLLLDEYELGPLDEAIDPHRSMLLKGCLVLGTRAGTIILSGRDKVPDPRSSSGS